MQLMVIGGSNSVMKEGYVSALRANLEKINGPLTQFTNVSLGANTCLMGIQTLAELNHSLLPDAVVVEYSVNDYAFFHIGSVDLWEAAFEGLLRQIRSRWPAASITCVILGRSDAEPSKWKALTATTKKLALHYSAAVADVPQHLENKGLHESIKALYSDPLHYSLQAQSLAGEFVAKTVAEDLRLSSLRERPLGDRISPDAFDPVCVVDFASTFDGGKRQFSNSWITVDTLVVPHGDQLSLDLPGPLIQLTFVSAPDAGTLSIQYAGHTETLHTLHTHSRDGINYFLPLSVYQDWWRKPPGGPVTIKALPKTEQPVTIPIYNMNPATTEDCRIYLYKALVRAV